MQETRLFKQIIKYKGIYIMLIPVLMFYILFCYIPMYGIIIAFKDYNVFRGILGSDWIGLENFRIIFRDDYFWVVLRNTLIISFYKLAFSFPVPILFALLINEIANKYFKRVVQTIIYLPRFISWVIIGGIIFNFLSINNGVVNQVIELFGGEPIAFMTKSSLFRGILITTDIWKNAGWGSIIYIAALAGVDPTLYEAARVDGAGKLRQTWHISLPGIRPTIMVMLILSLGNILNAGFDQIFVLYNTVVYEVGDIIDTYVYRSGLLYAKFSYATAVGLVKALAGMMMIVISDRLAKKFTGSGIL